MRVEAPAVGVEGVDHAANPGISAEEHETGTRTVHDLLMVDQRDVLAQKFLEKVPVGFLSLGRMREDHIDAAGQEVRGLRPFDAEAFVSAIFD